MDRGLLFGDPLAPPPSPRPRALPPHQVGWREWLSLPALGVNAIKAKIDTGARTCSLHAQQIEPYDERGCRHVRFWVCPLPRRPEVQFACSAPLVDRRVVTDSGGHREARFVIFTTLQLGDIVWDTEVTLTDRASMRFRMLLGRSALRGRFTIDPGSSYVAGPRLDRLFGRMR